MEAVQHPAFVQLLVLRLKNPERICFSPVFQQIFLRERHRRKVGRLLNLRDEAPCPQRVGNAAGNHIAFAGLHRNFVAEAFQQRGVSLPVGRFKLFPGNILLEAQKDVRRFGDVLARSQNIPALFLAEPAVPVFPGVFPCGVALQQERGFRVQHFDEHPQTGAIFLHVLFAQNGFRRPLYHVHQKIPRPVGENDLGVAEIGIFRSRAVCSRQGADPGFRTVGRIRRMLHAPESVQLPSAVGSYFIRHQRPGSVVNLHRPKHRLLFNHDTYPGKPSAPESRSESRRGRCTAGKCSSSGWSCR